MATQRSDIRRVLDEAEAFLPSSAIFAALRVACSKNVFGVTLAQMLDAKQVRKRRAPRAHRAQGVRFVYGPGPKPVLDGEARERQPKRVIGFMEAARLRKQKLAAARRARA